MKHPYTAMIIFLTIAMTLAIVPGPGRVALAGERLLSHGFETPSPLSTTKNRGTETSRLTLARAKQIALENNPTLASTLERINQAREAVNQAKADYFPTISVAGGMDYTEKTENTAAGFEENKYTNQVSATQILFNGFYRKYSNLSAEYKEKMSRAAQNDAKRLLSWSVAQAFLNTQLSIENIKIAQADMAFNQKQETEAIAKEKSGIGSYSDVLNFKTKVNSAKSALLSARQDLKESTYGLAALLGYEDACLPEGMTVSELTPDAQNVATALETRPGFDENKIKALVTGRPDIKEAFLEVQDAKANIQMAKSFYFPTLSLTGAYGTTSGETFHDEDSMGASLGISVSFDIFSGGAKKAKVRQTLSEKREKESDLLDAKNTAVSKIKISIQNIATAQQQLALQTENARLIEITRGLVQKEFNAGQVSLVRLNEAQNDLVTAQGNLSSARVSLILALEQFDYYVGKNINPV
jgi:outer membrane protein TolC